MPWRDALLLEGRNSKSSFPYKAVRTNRFAYHRYPTTGEEELYDLGADPYQLRSRHDDPALANTEGHPQVEASGLERLRGRGVQGRGGKATTAGWMIG